MLFIVTKLYSEWILSCRIVWIINMVKKNCVWYLVTEAARIVNKNHCLPSQKILDWIMALNVFDAN